MSKMPWQRLAWVGLTGLLTTTGLLAQDALKDAEKLRASHGFVRLSLLDEGETIALEQADGKRYPLRRQPGLGPMDHGLWLPPGEYRVARLVMKDDAPFLPVQVEAGRLSELGGLDLVPMDGLWKLPLQLRHAELEAQSRKAGELLGLDPLKRWDWRPEALAKPWKNAHATALGVIGNLIDQQVKRDQVQPLGERLRAATRPEEALALALKSAQALHEEPGVGSDGTLHYGAKLGQLKLRTPEGRWRTLDTGTLQTLNAVGVHGRQLLVGSRQGQLRGSSDGGQSWAVLKQLSGEEAVMEIAARHDRWWVISAELKPVPPEHTVELLAKTRRVRVYSAPLDQPGQLSLLRDIALQDEVQFYTGDGALAQWQGEHLLINVREQIERLHLPSMAWSSLKLPHAADLLRVRGERMMTALSAAGYFSSLSVSTDGGASWQKMPKPPGVLFRSIAFDSIDRGWTLRWNFSTGTEFYRYAAEQKDWLLDQKDPVKCSRMLSDAQGLPRYCVSLEGAVLALSEGRWQVEDLP